MSRCQTYKISRIIIARSYVYLCLHILNLGHLNVERTRIRNLDLFRLHFASSENSVIRIYVEVLVQTETVNIVRVAAPYTDRTHRLRQIECQLSVIQTLLRKHSLGNLLLQIREYRLLILLVALSHNRLSIRVPCCKHPAALIKTAILRLRTDRDRRIVCVIIRVSYHKIDIRILDLRRREEGFAQSRRNETLSGQTVCVRIVILVRIQVIQPFVHILPGSQHNVHERLKRKSLLVTVVLPIRNVILNKGIRIFE